MQHCVCCGRKKLPFAEYSVVKDQIGAKPPSPRLARLRGPQGPAPLARWKRHPRSVARGVSSPRSAPSPEVSATHYVANLITSALRSGRRNYPSAAPCGTAAWHCSALDRDRRRRGRRPESLTQPRRNFSRLRCLWQLRRGRHVTALPFQRACLPSRSRVHLSSRRRLVENTGLEPVTSWLQTRRSPS